MRLLLASTCLTPIALLVAMPAAAQTTIATARTTPVTTSTVNNGAPSDVTITSAGSVTVTSGTAVTVDSNNKVINQGTVQITNADNATGIGAVAGGSGSIENSGKIIVDETYAPTDTDNDGDLDGPFASGTNRAGIRTFGAFTGSITNLAAGTITVEGNDSFGIVLGGALTGNLSTDGTINVIGDRSVGVRTGDVTGKIRIAGTVTAQGAGASAVQINGNVSGALELQGTITSTGYRSTTAPSDVTKLDADDLLQGGPAVSITGNVAGGVIVAIPPTTSTTNTDVDNDGILDANEGSGVITSYGAAPGMQIGAVGNSVTLGPVANSAGYGLIIQGSVSGNGVYTGVSGNGLVIGGLGGAVTVTNGISITGTVAATAVNASATALRIGSGATVSVIQSSGIVSASGGTAAGQSARGIVVDAGATVGTIRNSGSISVASGADASAIGIIDLSGGVTLVENSGAIKASGAGTGRTIAIDLSANTSGATVNQTVVTTATAASIIGDVKFGSGNDTLNLADGTMTGNALFGAGANKLTLSGDATMSGNASFGGGADAMSLAGTSVFKGLADFGGGADTLTLTGTSVFSGTLANAGSLAVIVTGGSFGVTGTGSTAIGSLQVGAAGSLGVTIDTTTNTATRYVVAGTANFDAGSKLAITLNGLVTTTNNFTVISAGTITGASNLTASSLTLPYIYKSGITTGGPANEITISISRKTTTELGLNRSGASAYDAIYTALGTDTKVAGAFLNITEADAFKGAVRSMLPDHAGGAFEAVTSGSRAIGRMLTDGGAPFSDQGKWGYWIEQVAFGRAKSIGNTASYDVNGWGTSGGAEYKTKVGNFGVSLAYIHGNDEDNGSDNVVSSDQYEAALYWRSEWAGLRPFARVSAAKIDFAGTRQFSGATGTEAVARTADGKWGGKLYSATGGASYEGSVGRLTFRPIVSFDYYRLTEDAYTETGGGTAFNLIVDKRGSDELAGNASLAVGLAFGSKEDGWFHAEVEGGRRQILSGNLGATTAKFVGGQSFTLVPDARTSGWIGRVRASGGSEGFRLGAEVGGEEQQGRAAISLRATLQLGF